MVETMTETIEMVKVEQVGLFRAFATQSNLDSRLVRETWYGHHAPWCRMFLFFVLATTATIVGVLGDMQYHDAPILRTMTNEALEDMKNSHKDCLRSICEVAKSIPLDCIVNENRQGARTDFEDYDGPFQIPFPEICVQASINTLGPSFESFVEDQGGFSKFNLFSLGDNVGNSTTTAEVFSLVQVRSQCNVGPFKHFVPLVNTSGLDAGQRLNNVLEKAVCDVVPILEPAFEILLFVRYVVFVFLVSGLALLQELGDLFGLGFTLMFTSFLVRWTIPWPKDFVGYKRITLFTIWRTLLLLSYVTRERDTYSISGGLGAIILGAIHILSAFKYKDRKAAMVWVDLVVLWFGMPYLFPFLDSIASFVGMFDYLNLVAFTANILGLFVPGSGWWKLVHLYAFWRAYPLREQVKSGIMGRTEPAKED